MADKSIRLALTPRKIRQIVDGFSAQSAPPLVARVGGTHCELALYSKAIKNRFTEETGAIDYILLWALGVPASLLFVIFLMRGCT